MVSRILIRKCIVETRSNLTDFKNKTLQSSGLFQNKEIEKGKSGESKTTQLSKWTRILIVRANKGTRLSFNNNISRTIITRECNRIREIKCKIPNYREVKELRYLADLMVREKLQ